MKKISREDKNIADFLSKNDYPVTVKEFKQIIKKYNKEKEARQVSSADLMEMWF